MRKIHLILVDDHKMFLDGIKAVLSQQKDIEIISIVNRAKLALKVMETNVPDLLITDISMPEMNGLEFIQVIKRKWPNLKILVISMFKQLQSFDKVDGYLLKSIDTIELIRVIKEIVLENKKCFYNDDRQKHVNFEFNKRILTPRETEIVQLIANGLTVDEIANKLFLSRHTVETHKKNIFLKLQVNNSAGLIKKAMYLGFLD